MTKVLCALDNLHKSPMTFLCIVLILQACQAVETSSCRQVCDSYHTSKYRQPGFILPVPVGEVKVTGTEIAPSGLAHSRKFQDVLYFVSDDGKGNIVYAINANNAEVIGSITVTDATNVDWEDLAVGQCPKELDGSCIYVQDDGKDGAWPEHTIYIIKEGTNPATHVNRKADQIIVYEFQSGDEFRESASIFVDCKGDIFFFEALTFKDHPVRLFQIKYINGKPTAVDIFNMSIPSTEDRPVAASLSDDCSELLIKTYDKVYFIPIEKDVIYLNRLQVLPYLPNADEGSVEWSPGNDKYFILSSKKPFVLKRASKVEDAPVPRFKLGRVLGTIDTSVVDEINGLAASRNRPGFVYVAASFGNSDILILQTSGAKSIGVLKTGITIPSLSFQDIATGTCPPQFTGESCIFINTYQLRGETTYKVFIFEEPPDLSGETQFTLTEDNSFEYELPAGQSVAPTAIMIGRKGEIYMIDYVQSGETNTVFQLVINNGATNNLVPLATFRSPSLNDGPAAADMSPCFNEILVKFWDVVLLFDVKNDKITDTFAEEPYLLPYVPELEGNSIAFAGCNEYLTTAHDAKPVRLMSYDRA